jgi:hypothetical protein
MFVVGAANVSKAFWGAGRHRAKVAPLRQALRDSLGVDDQSPLYDVGMRNNFEHYDERIDRWWTECPRHNLLDRGFGAPSVVSLDDKEMFRIYDPDTARIIFWGEAFHMQPIASECDRIFPIGEREASKPHWDGRH